MMIRAKWLFAALALPLTIGTTFAAVDPDKLPQVACSDLKFSPAILAKYPKAPAACLDARVYKGHRYAKFEAKVYISSPQFMTVELLDASGATVTTFSFKPGAGTVQGVHVNGKLRKFSDMAVGEKLTFWVSEKRLTAMELPGSTANSWAVLPPT
jgi:hypothetical protein